MIDSDWDAVRAAPLPGGIITLSSGENLKTAIHSPLAVATLAGLLVTTGCATPPPAATTPVTATAAPSMTATEAPTPSGKTLTEAVSPVPEAPKAPMMKTFTFPDGHVSFTHPASWTVTVKPGPALNPEAQKTSFDATVVDASGSEVAHVLSGMYGDGAAGPVTRTVLDHAPVPGINDTRGESTEFGFAYDELPGEGSTAGPYYFMDVRRAHEFLPTQAVSGSNQVLLPNGVLTAVVVLGGSASKPAFASPAAAKAWMESEQYAQLRAMLLSLMYS